MSAVTSTMAAPVAAENSAPILSLNNIEVVYDRVILVLKGVSLSVPTAASWRCSELTAPARRRR